MYLSWIVVFFLIFLSTSFVSAQEFRSFNIPENSIQVFEIPLQRGEELQFAIFLQDKDMLEFSIEMPDKNQVTFGEIRDFLVHPS